MVQPLLRNHLNPSQRLCFFPYRKNSTSNKALEMSLTVDELVAKCVSIGLVMRRSPSFELTHPPVTLQTTKISAKSFDRITSLQTYWNALIDAVARDMEFLASSLATCGISDQDFTGRLIQIMKEVYMGDGRGPVQQAMLGVFRTDYMRVDVHEDSLAQEWRNVEINTISCSFAALTSKVNEFHRFLDAAETAEKNNLHTSSVIHSRSDVNTPSALAAAHDYVKDSTSRPQGSDVVVPVVVFVIQENERNTGDQYLLAFNLLEHHGVRSIRRTMSELHAGMQLVSVGTDQPPAAVIDHRYWATVFYFRCAYVPQDFKDEKCWAARKAMEQSNAIKCPSIPYHLAGFKKIQQLLSIPSILKRFISDDKAAVELQATFMTQASLDEDEVGIDAVTASIQDALDHPRKYVLKPQLEGGGNLYSGEKLVHALSVPKSDPLHRRLRKEFVLMERIPFPKFSGRILRFGEVHEFKDNLCCELGVYGSILSTGTRILRNETDGTLVRTKPADVDDGGVMAGVAALDSLSILV